MMKRAILVSWIVGWLGTTASAQIRVPGDDGKLLRQHIAWLAVREFNLDRAKETKLETALSPEPIPLVATYRFINNNYGRLEPVRMLDQVIINNNYGRLEPVRMLDQVIISRNGILALTEAMNRDQLESFFESTRERKERANRAILDRSVAVLDSVCSLTAEQRETVIEEAREWLKYSHIKPGIVLLLERNEILWKLALDRELVWNQLTFFDPDPQPPFFARLFTERQKAVWQLVLDNYWLGLIHGQSLVEDDPGNPFFVDPDFVDWDEIVSMALFDMDRLFPGDVPMDPVGLNFIQRGIKRRLAQGIAEDDLHEELTSDPDSMKDFIDEELGKDRNLLEEFVKAAQEANIGGFGELDAAATKRLMLARRGTFHRLTIEAKAEAKTADQNKQPFAARIVAPGKTDSEGLPAYIRPLWKRIVRDVNNYPLYRQAVEKVLSKESYAAYSAARQERESFRLAVKRQAALAALDLNLLLCQEQRESAETWLDQSDPGLSVAELYRKMIAALDRDHLSDWQRSRL